MLLEVRVERQHHERQVDVDEAHEHRERAEQERHRLGPERGEHAVDRLRERSVGAEDDHPRVDADQEVAPERQDHEQQHEVPVLLRALRDQRRERVGEHEAGDRRHERVDDRLEEHLEVDDVLGEPHVALDVQVEPAVLADERREAAELAGRAERRRDHDERRDREEDEQVGERGPGDRPLAPAGFPVRAHGRRRHSAMKWPASIAQLVSTASPTSKNLVRPLCEFASSASMRAPPGVSTL